VMTSGRGDALASEDLLAAMRGLLLPQTTIITPNSLEARRLAENQKDEEDDLETEEPEASLGLQDCARQLIGLGSAYVLITGAHEQGNQVINTLYNVRGVVHRLHWERLPGSYHGSGCTLASALAACLARGRDVAEAAREAQDYTYQTLRAAFRPGMGQFIPDRLFWARESDD